MAEPSLDIERIVRQVLAELAVAPGATAGLSSSASEKSPEGTAGQASSGTRADPAVAPMASGDLVVSARVVTLAELAGRLPAVRRLVVPPQAVVTPAVRDELRRRNVALVYNASEATQTVAIRLVAVTVGKQHDSSPLLGTLRAEGVEVQPHRSDCLLASTDLLAGEIARGDTLGLLLTRHTAAGLCLANRLRGVRAVAGTEPGEIAATTASVGANLLVLDPGAMGLFQLKRTVGEFCRTGTRPCPEVFRARLS